MTTSGRSISFVSDSRLSKNGSGFFSPFHSFKFEYVCLSGHKGPFSTNPTPFLSFSRSVATFSDNYYATVTSRISSYSSTQIPTASEYNNQSFDELIDLVLSEADESRMRQRPALHENGELGVYTL